MQPSERDPRPAKSVCSLSETGFAAYREQHMSEAVSLQVGSLKFPWLFLQHISSKKSPRLGKSRAKSPLVSLLVRKAIGILRWPALTCT